MLPKNTGISSFDEYNSSCNYSSLRIIEPSQASCPYSSACGSSIRLSLRELKGLKDARGRAAQAHSAHRPTPRCAEFFLPTNEACGTAPRRRGRRIKKREQRRKHAPAARRDPMPAAPENQAKRPSAGDKRRLQSEMKPLSRTNAERPAYPEHSLALLFGFFRISFRTRTANSGRML